MSDTPPRDHHLDAQTNYPNAVRFIECISSLLGVLRPHMNDLEDLDLPETLAPRHKHVLMQLSMYGAQSVSALAQRVAMTLPSTSQTVTQLAELGYVKRTEDPTDHRRTVVSLEGKMAAVSARILNSRLGPLEEVLLGVSRAALESTIELSLEVAATLRAKLDSLEPAQVPHLQDQLPPSSGSTRSPR